MYKIIGGDGREYGPITSEQLRQWIAEGRVNAQTQAQTEGDTGWKPLASFSEFANELSGAAGASTTPPIIGAVDADQLAQEILVRDYQIKIGDSIQRGWELVKRNFWLFVGASFVAGLIAAGGGIPYIGPLIGLVVGGPMMGGLYGLYLKKVRGQPTTFGDIFLGFSAAFVPLMLAHIVSGLLSCVGLLLCLVPGIYLSTAWIFTVPLVFDKKMDFWPAMELSRKVVTKHWWTMFGLLILLALLNVLGLLACCVGILVTSAISEAALMYVYEDIFGRDTTKAA